MGEKVGRGGSGGTIRNQRNPLTPPSPLRGEGVKRRARLNQTLKHCSANQRRPFMKIITTLAALLLLGGEASAQSLDELKHDGSNTDNVLTYGMGYNLRRYSALKQIDKTTVKRLVPVWNLSLDNPWGEQAQPLIYNGVMYVTNAKATVAIDVATGRQIWKTMVDWLPETPRVVCCGVSNKGAAIFNGKVFRTTLDAHVVAL